MKFIKSSLLSPVKDYLRDKLSLNSILEDSKVTFQNVYSDPWPGDSSVAQNFLYGNFEFGGKLYTLNDFLNVLINPDLLDSQTLLQIHSFEWFRDLRCITDNASRRLARKFILQWIDSNGKWNNQLASNSAFDPYIIGIRVSNWISCFDFFGASADEEFLISFNRSLALQWNILQKQYRYVSDPIQKLITIKGLVLSSIALKKQHLDKYLTAFKEGVEAQLYADGGHVSRDPIVHLYLLKEVIDVRSVLKSIHHEQADFLNILIQKMVPVVRLFRHGDGEFTDFATSKRKLIPFSRKPSQAYIDIILSVADIKGRPPSKLPDMGYERINTKSGQVIVNTKPHFDRANHFYGPGTGVLNFEWSLGKNRHIKQADLVMQTKPNHWIHVPSSKDMPQVIKISRQVKEGTCLLEADFESVIPAHRLSNGPSIIFNHQRQLYLGDEKGDLRGQDRVLSSQDTLCAVRFIFYPGTEVSVMSQQDNFNALIRIPDLEKGRDKKYSLWRFICNQIEDMSVQKEEDTSALLLIQHSKAEKPITIRWAFHKIK